MEEELKRAEERAEMCEQKIVQLEEMLRAIGENMKALEVTEEKALLREEKYKDEVRSIVGWSLTHIFFYVKKMCAVKQSIIIEKSTQLKIIMLTSNVAARL